MQTPTSPEEVAALYESARGAAAFNVVHETVTSPGFMENLRAQADHMRDGLEEITEAHSEKVLGHTGMGAMQGLVLDSAARVAAFRKVGLEQTGIFTGTGGVHGNILRLGGRLDAPRDIVDEALNKIEDTMGRI